MRSPSRRRCGCRLHNGLHKKMLPLEKLKEKDLSDEQMTKEWMNTNIRMPFFSKSKTRDLWRLWEAKDKADRVQDLELGSGGAHRDTLPVHSRRHS